MLDPDFAHRSSLFLFDKKWGFGDALVSVLKNDFLTAVGPFRTHGSGPSSSVADALGFMWIKKGPDGPNVGAQLRLFGRYSLGGRPWCQTRPLRHHLWRERV